MERREFVKCAGMASVAASVGLAGCSDGGDGGGDEDTGGSVTAGERARYNQWVTEDTYNGEELFAISLNIAALPDEDSEGTETSDGDSEEPEDPLAGLPLTFLLFGGLAAGLGTYGLGLEGLSEEDSGTEKIHIAGGLVFEGDFDAGSLETSVEEAGATETEDYHGFTIYTDAGGDDETAIAISEGAVIVVSKDMADSVTDTLPRAKVIADASFGEATPLSEERSVVEDLMTALPNRPVMGVAYSDEAKPLNEEDESDDGGTGSRDDSTTFADTDLSGRANGLAASADLTGDSLTSSVALRYESEGEVDDRSDIEDAIGNDANDRVVDTDGPLVVVEGSYDEVPEYSEQ